MRDTEIFAHSLPADRDTRRWEPLSVHLLQVGRRAEAFAAQFSAGPLGFAGGLLHDIGKCSVDYQDYIAQDLSRGPDHSTAGARAVVARYGRLGRLLAFAIAGHHSGLMDGSGTHGKGRSLSDRLDAVQYRIPAFDNWRDHVPDLPSGADLRIDKPLSANPDYPGFETAFLIRMLFSCLVDADFLETERFYATADGQAPPARGGTLTRAHVDRIRIYMASRRKDDTRLNRLRAEILDHAIGKAALTPGPFTLTVPTGGGKTLTSLTFALEHALAHGMRRIVYVIPFTSIIEQTAQVFREALQTDTDILEHHASFDWDRLRPARESDDEAEDASVLAKLRRDAENWDAPIVVTTAVQFFESLFAARTSRARKLHNLVNSVIVLDEAQILPVRLLRPCMAALDELTRNYGASVVLCTATQPAWRKQDAALPKQRNRTSIPGLDISADRELAPRPRELYEELRRVRVDWRREPITDDEICARFIAQPQMLCIVNSRAHARELFERIAHLPGARHLTTLMYARHRRDVLDQVKQDLANHRPVRLVATSLIEAGVDISFPEVWRAATGLDSIAQAAGRCNREGLLDGGGLLVVFTPAARKTPPAIDTFYQAARDALRRSDLDPLGLDAIHLYFRELYHERGYEALDAARLGDEPYPIMPEIAKTREELTFPFSRIAQAFRLIDDVMVPVLIPRDAESKRCLDALEHAPFPPVEVLRKLQQYLVPVPRKTRADLLASGAVQAIRHEVYGDRFIYLASLSLYAETHGLKLDDPTWRASEENVL